MPTAIVIPIAGATRAGGARKQTGVDGTKARKKPQALL